MKTAIEMLREFANFQGDGMRGVVRMRVMREEAKILLKRVDSQRERSKQKKETR